MLEIKKSNGDLSSEANEILDKIVREELVNPVLSEKNIDPKEFDESTIEYTVTFKVTFNKLEE